MGPGSRVGDYVILHLVGGGGMTDVYLAEHVRTGLRVVVKQLKEHLAINREFVERFVRGAEIMRELRHPHLARVFEFIVQDGQYFMAEEYLSGGSLADVLEKGTQITDEQVLLWCRDVLNGINYAHE